MHGRLRLKQLRPLVLLAIVAGGLCVLAATASASSRHSSASGTTLVVGEGGHYVRNFNPFAPGATDPTKALIYEPLWIVSFAANNKEYPWLATAYSWSKDLKTLTFTIRQGVRWSDGKPMTAADVYYTLTAGKSNPLMNQGNLWGDAGIASSVTMSGSKVAIHFKKVDTTAFATLVDNVYIVPKHIWSKVGNVQTFTNPNPVGTGPFTQIKSLSVSSVDIGKNPYYWQKGKPAFDTIRFADNTNAVAGLESGQMDWNGAFVPNVQKVYDDRNPNFHHYYASASTPVVLFVNLLKSPFTSRALRGALSKAINRQAVVNAAEFGDAGIADATGLNGQFPTWVAKTVPQSAAKTDLTAAKALLSGAGFKTSSDGSLLDPTGKKVSIDLLTNADFPDYVAATQIIAQSWQQLGIDVTVDPKHFADWYDSLLRGNYDVGISYTFGASTPIGYYDLLLGGENAQPIGTPAGGNNYSRYSNSRMDHLISLAKSTASPKLQQALAEQMEKLYVRDLPAIPVFNPPVFYQYNTSRFTGWPTKANYYVAGPPSRFPDRLVVITHLTPKK